MISTFFGGAALGRAAGCACKRDLIVISWGFSGKTVYSKTKKHGNIMGIGDMIWSGDEKYGDLMGM